MARWIAGGGSGSSDHISAADYGFLPTATAAANETAFPLAVAAAKAAGLPLYIGPGTFQKTNGLDLKASPSRADGIVLYGAGKRATRIVVTTDTAELLQVGGYSHHISDFSISHSTTTPTGTMGDGLVFYKAAYSTFKRLFIESAGSLVAVSSANVFEPGTSGGTGNYMFSCVFEDITVNRYYKSGIYLRGVGSTGSVWTNTYVQNGSPGAALTSTGAPVDILGVDETVFNQLNIEDHLGTQTALLLNQANVTFNALHFERVPLTGFRAQYVRVYGISQAIVNGLTVAFSDVAATGTSDWSALFSVGLGGVIEAKGVWIHDSTKTAATSWRLAESDDTNARNAVTIATPVIKDGSPAFTTLTTSGYANGIKRLGDASYVPVTIPAHYARRYKSNPTTAFALTASFTEYKLPLDAVATDSTGTYVTVTNSDGSANADTLRVTQPGMYLPTGQVSFAGGTSALHQIVIKVNGTSRIAWADTFAGTRAVPVPSSPIRITQAQIDAGGAITLWVYAETTAVTVTGQFEQHTSFGLTYLGS